jgi:hypothetical protein
MKTIIRLTAVWILAGFICYLIGLPTATIVKTVGWGTTILMGILAFFASKTEGKKDKTFDGDTIGMMTIASGIASFILFGILYVSFKNDAAPATLWILGILCTVIILIYSSSAKKYIGTAMVIGYCLGIIMFTKTTAIPCIIALVWLIGLIKRRKISGIVLDTIITIISTTVIIVMITEQSIWPPNMTPNKDILNQGAGWLLIGSCGLIAMSVSWNKKKNEVKDI